MYSQSDGHSPRRQIHRVLILRKSRPICRVPGQSVKALGGGQQVKTVENLDKCRPVRPGRSANWCQKTTAQRGCLVGGSQRRFCWSCQQQYTRWTVSLLHCKTFFVIWCDRTRETCGRYLRLLLPVISLDIRGKVPHTSIGWSGQRSKSHCLVVVPRLAESHCTNEHKEHEEVLLCVWADQANRPRNHSESSDD